MGNTGSILRDKKLRPGAKRSYTSTKKPYPSAKKSHPGAKKPRSSPKNHVLVLKILPLVRFELMQRMMQNPTTVNREHQHGASGGQ